MKRFHFLIITVRDKIKFYTPSFFEQWTHVFTKEHKNTVYVAFKRKEQAKRLQKLLGSKTNRDIFEFKSIRYKFATEDIIPSIGPKIDPLVSQLAHEIEPEAWQEYDEGRGTCSNMSGVRVMESLSIASRLIKNGWRKV